MNRRCYNCMKEFYIPEGHEEENNVCPHCGFVENSVPENSLYLCPGVTLHGRYTIGAVIGAGGFGITYKAWDNTLENVVAIKEYFPQGLVLRDNRREDSTNVSIYNMMDDSYRRGKERFLKEARSLAKFNSKSGTVVIYDFFEENDTAYIVMEYLDGCNMKEYMDSIGETVPNGKLRVMIETVCDVLKGVHEVGLIHRDISPDNIFMCRDGAFKLIDFGSVKQGLSDNNLSSTIILKHGYAPIEQYSKNGKIGAWTDIYSLGATIYRLATGVLPQESVERVTSDELEDIYILKPDLSQSFCKAVMKALSIQIKDRYQTIADFKDDILAAPDYEYEKGTKNIENEDVPEVTWTDGRKTQQDEEELEPVYVKDCYKDGIDILYDDEDDLDDEVDYDEKINRLQKILRIMLFLMLAFLGLLLGITLVL
ncbi:MAG: protein kinase [Eubacterium sp.]|nr:protein kinase [Eubacterium sp.]